MNETRKRREIKDYFQKIKRHNEIKHNLQYIIIIVFFLLFFVLLSGNIFLIIGYFVFFVIACLAYLPGFSLSFEKVIDRWLEEDKRKLVDKAKGKLQISGQTFSKEILIWNGINERFAARINAGRTKRKLDPNSVDEELNISPEDYYVQTGLDNRKRFGVYTFGVIFLCQTFLAYYRCYWNFIEGASINDEFSEYLYIGIASVRYEEDSSSNIDRNKKPNISKELRYSSFVITTYDSKEIRFYLREDVDIGYAMEPYISDRKEPSKAQEAVQLIRDQIRQRRVDYQQVRAVDSDFKL